MTRKDLPEILYQIIKELGGKATMMQVFRKFWSENKNLLNEVM